jgi:pimeloyl-ACP methyl ester carboxylesterase
VVDDVMRGGAVRPVAHTYTVEVDGGELAVARWGEGGRAVLAAHGITASYQAWSAVAEHVADEFTLYAPDLRGRGDSAGLPGPYGMAQHARDLAAVLDDAGVDRAVVVGHSMGGFVAAAFANHHADRARGVVLVDGGPPFQDLPPDVDPDAVISAVVGPAIARLDKRFETREEYRRFWREHPALRDSDVDPARIDAYADHDLHGPEGALRSKVSADAVRADAADTLDADGLRAMIIGIDVPAVLLLAGRGMLDQPEPLYADEVVEGLATARGPLEVIRVPATNHYTIAVGEAGALAIAHQVRRFAVADGEG